MFDKRKNIHFVGIGGSGMSGIAEVLVNLGHNVTGSDLKKTEVTEHLRKLGAKIFIGHNKNNIKNADVVVTSTAVQSDNPEVRSAVKNKIPVIPRIEMLAELARLKYAVTVAGTHGKTTTTSLTALVMGEGGLDPTIVIGGRLKNLKSSAKLGKGKFLVAEADESDGSFLKLSPVITAVTNIDNDHLDYYGNMENLKAAFVKHINSVPFYGSAVLCADNAAVKEILPLIKRRYITYGFSKGADLTAVNIKKRSDCTEFSIKYKKKVIGKACIKLLGLHNILNCLAACGIGLELGININKIVKALSSYDGVKRRLEIKGEKEGVTVIDDYGHHPTEIEATLAAIKYNWPKRKLLVLFQPHRYTRTQNLLGSFGKVFKNADEVYLTEIYAASESPIKGVNALKVKDAINKNSGNAGMYVSAADIAKKVESGNIFLTLGAGDVYKQGEELLTLI
jgi:UDP-N-acetylmuramate--alanine ligase